MIVGCPRHPGGNRSCYDARCQATWVPDGAPTPEEQLTRWVSGDAVCPNTRHECCPDFSCCRPSMMWPQDKRKRFIEAIQPEREKMMLGSLVTLAEDEGVNVHVTRGNPKDRE